MDKALMELKEALEKEIEVITKKNDITPAELERLDKAVDIIKDIETICAMKEYSYEPDEDLGYSQSRPMYMRDTGASYRRGRNQNNGQYMSRDPGYSGMHPVFNDWEYSQRMPYAYSPGSVSYDSGTGYMGRADVRDNLKRMMANASTDKERMTIQQFLDNWKEV